MTMQMIDVPAGLNGVVAAETAIGAVNGDEGYFHYGQYDATYLARHHALEEVWFLIREGRLPSAGELEAFRAAVARHRFVPPELLPVVRAVATTSATPLSQLRSVLSIAAPLLGLDPVIDIDESKLPTAEAVQHWSAAQFASAHHFSLSASANA